MFFRISLIASAAVISLVLGLQARAQTIKYDSEPGTNFSAYKTYTWKRADKARYPDELTDKILMSAIDAELTKKGLTKIDGDTADLYVIYQLAIVETAEWSSFSTDVPWLGGPHTLAGFPGAGSNSTPLIRVGWLILDFYDVKQKKQVWEATVTKTLGNSKDPKRMEQNTRKVMAKVFNMYPPKQ